MILAGDIGGTNCRYAIFDGQNLSHIRVWPTSQSTGIAYDLERYQHEVGVSIHPTRACVAIAGPVSGSEVSLTNADWNGSIADFPCPAIWVNDLVAAIQGLDLAEAEHIAGPKAIDKHAHRVALGVGTGFGQALRIGDQAFAGEGGHASFAPTSQKQHELYSFLRNRKTRVRVEDVCSGMGMENILDFLLEQSGTVIERKTSAGAMFGTATDSFLLQGLDIFLSSLGSVIGDTAIRQLPHGGIWLCGGVAKKMKPHYIRASFQEALQQKEPMNRQVASIPIFVVLEEELGLIGAGRIAYEGLCGFEHN
ncbi:MAG: hypothetical protein CL916_07090 [Deltaproteobacteria bacterium]|nr:hypothetical protein [Deltaproteobacteria bacterium]